MTAERGAPAEPPTGGDRSGAPSFTERVVAAVARSGPLCAGLDPSPEVLARWGLPDDPGGLRAFGSTCLEAFASAVPVIKPQVAFYERFGSAGFAALEELLAAAGRAGLIVIADAKRGDISSTARAYAHAWLDPASPLAADAVTVIPYVGLGALRPLIDAAASTGRGVLVVVATSNPEGRPLQEAETAPGVSVEDALLGEVARCNAGPAAGPVPGAGGVAGPDCAAGVAGAVGAVVGATRRAGGFPLPEVGGVLLAPGIGAQGAGAGEVAGLFGGCRPGTVLPSASRSLLGAGPSVGSLRGAAERLRDEMAGALS